MAGFTTDWQQKVLDHSTGNKLTGAGAMTGVATAASGAVGTLDDPSVRSIAALLPPTSTPFEFAMGRASGEGLPLPVPLRELWDPWTCPMALLPWLAWALSVDIWDDR
jgi:hypothetical protein